LGEDEVKRFILRLPPDLHQQLKALADADLRSLHAEILVLLKEAVTTRGEEDQNPKNLAGAGEGGPARSNAAKGMAVPSAA
jgi:hypothetical protein